MRKSAVAIGTILATMSICTMLNILAIKESSQIKQEPTSITIDNSIHNDVHYENSTIDSNNDNSIDYNNEEHYDIDSQTEENNTNSTSNNADNNNNAQQPPRVVQSQPEQQQTNPAPQSNNKLQEQPQKEEQKTPQQKQQPSTNASSVYNNNSTTSTPIEKKEVKQQEPEEQASKPSNVCEYCGKTGTLHKDLRVWMDTNGIDHITHNRDCTEAYKEQYIQSDSELNCN